MMASIIHAIDIDGSRYEVARFDMPEPLDEATRVDLLAKVERGLTGAPGARVISRRSVTGAGVAGMELDLALSGGEQGRWHVFFAGAQRMFQVSVRGPMGERFADGAVRFFGSFKVTATPEAAKAVVRELKPVLGVNVPITGSPWLMTGLASLLGRSNLPSRFPAVGNVTISNVPGPPMPLYMAGARIVHYYPVSIPYHGSALNITVHSYAGLLELGLTACRRILSQDESYELIEHLRTALREIEALPPVDAVTTAGVPTVLVPSEPNKASTKRTPVGVMQPEAPEKPAVANEAKSRPNRRADPSTTD